MRPGRHAGSEADGEGGRLQATGQRKALRGYKLGTLVFLLVAGVVDAQDPELVEQKACVEQTENLDEDAKRSTKRLPAPAPAAAPAPVPVPAGPANSNSQQQEQE